MSLIKLIFKFPLRIVCKKKGHILEHRNGFFGMFAPKYTWTCKRCGIRSTGDWESLHKKSMLPKNNQSHKEMGEKK
jgi:hypothetical protein